MPEELTQREEIEKQGAAIVPAVTALFIVDEGTYQQAAGFLKQARALRKVAVAIVAPMKSAAQKAKDEALALERLLCAPFDQVIAIIPPKLGAYEQEQRRKAEAARVVAQAELRRQEEERRLAEAIALEQAGKRDEAEAAIAPPITVPVVVAAPAVPKIEGLTYRDQWGAQVTDFGQLITFVAQYPGQQGLLLPNEAALNAMARSLKGGFNIPGVIAVNSRVPVTR